MIHTALGHESSLPKRPTKLLIVRLDASGDVLMCTPAIHALRHAGFQLSLLTSTSGALVGSRLDDIDQVIIFDAPWMKASSGGSGAQMLAMAEQLRGCDFDAAVILHSYSQSPLPAAMLCQLAGIPRQLAYCRENPYQLLSDWVREPEPESLVRHEVQRQLDLVKRWGGILHGEPRLRICLSADDRHAAGAALARTGLQENERFLLLHPGATAPSRRFPLSSWIETCKLLLDIGKLPLVLAGSVEERPLLMQLQQGVRRQRLPVIDTLDFGGLAALIGYASLLIANNSAPAHLAAAMNTPVVVLYASTNPQHTPWTEQSRVLSYVVPCAPCYRSTCPQLHHACMTNIRPSDIVNTVIDLLKDIEKTASCFEKYDDWIAPSA